MPSREPRVRRADIRVPRWWPVAVLLSLLFARVYERRQLRELERIGAELGTYVGARDRAAVEREARLLKLTAVLTWLTVAVSWPPSRASSSRSLPRRRPHESASRCGPGQSTRPPRGNRRGDRYAQRMAQQGPYEGWESIPYLAELNRNIRRALQPAFEVGERLREQVARQLDGLPPIQEVMLGIERAAEVARQALRRSFPENWDDLDFEQCKPALALGLEHGVNVVWTPRAEIIRELVAAVDDEARARILVEREADILDDIESVLVDVTHSGLGHLPALARKAVNAHRGGHREAGHALAGAVLSGVVHENFGFHHFAEARARFQRDHPMHVEMSLLRITAVLYTFGRALQPTDVAPPGFNRHASLHALAGQYTPANAVAAMLLLAGVLRELHFWLTAQDQEDEQEAA
jgi:hypothetical protein